MDVETVQPAKVVLPPARLLPAGLLTVAELAFVDERLRLLLIPEEWQPEQFVVAEHIEALIAAKKEPLTTVSRRCMSCSTRKHVYTIYIHALMCRWRWGRAGWRSTGGPSTARGWC